MRRTTIVGLAAALLLCVLASAWAGGREINDPDDTTGVLDLRYAQFFNDGDIWAFTVKTYEGFNKEVLRSRGVISVAMKLNKDNSYVTDITLGRNGKLKGTVRFCEPKRCTKTGTVEARKSSGKAVILSPMKSDYPKVGDKLRWNVTSALDCPGDECSEDRAPDRGWKRVDV
jgi:hypothetical protein